MTQQTCRHDLVVFASELLLFWNVPRQDNRYVNYVSSRSSKRRCTTRSLVLSFSSRGNVSQLGHLVGKVRVKVTAAVIVLWTLESDSTVLAHIMKLLNDRYNYGLNLFLLSIDEGITGYRDDSLEVFAIIYLCFININIMSDSEEKSDSIQSSSQDSKLWRALWVDHGCHCGANREKE